MCAIRADDGLAHPDPVGLAIIEKLCICDEEGELVPPQTVVQVFFEGGSTDGKLYKRVIRYGY